MIIIKKNKVSDVVKANRKGSREAELENQHGWSAKTKKHKTIKDYDRSEKYKINPNNIFNDDDN
jgi:hypothetical protein